MSRNTNTKNSVKPFCKVCFDANKPESQYNSHFVRRTKDPNSEILCPIVLATECRYCHKLGHTISKCVLREQNNARYNARHNAAQAPVRTLQAQSHVVTQTPKSNNRFAAFEIDDDVVEEVKVVNNAIEYPSLGGSAASVAPVKASYAKAFTSTPAPAKWINPKQVEISKPVVIEQYIEESSDEEVEVPTYEPPVTTWVYKPPVYDGWDDENF